MMKGTSVPTTSIKEDDSDDDFFDALDQFQALTYLKSNQNQQSQGLIEGEESKGEPRQEVMINTEEEKKRSPSLDVEPVELADN